MSIDINGFDIAPLTDDAGVSHVDVENIERSESTRLEGSVFAYKRRWQFRLSPTATDQEHRALRNWVKGRHWSWNFDRVDGATTRFNVYEDGGGPRFNAFAGSVTATSPSRFGTWSMRVSSGGVAAATLQFASPQTPYYSWGTWKLNTSGTFQFCCNTYDGSTSRYFVDAYTGVTSAFAWASVTTASGFFTLSLQGEDASGTNSNTAIFGPTYVFPYTLTTPQINALGARTTMTPAPPFVELDGGLNDDSFPIVVKGYVDSEPIKEVVINGSPVHSRWLQVSFVER
jgi:hypothetical protein